jgi:hypothetical protein
MGESKSSPSPDGGARRRAARDYSVAYVALGILSMAAGAGLFHPGLGFLVAGLALTGIGLFGAPRSE